MIKKRGIVQSFANKFGNVRYIIKDFNSEYVYYYETPMKTRKLEYIVDDVVEFEVTNTLSLWATNIKREALQCAQ